MLTIAIVNRKGGCGKTTSVLSLGGAFALSGKRTLLVDMDPQASLSKLILSQQQHDLVPDHRTTLAIFDSDPEPADIILPTDVDGLSLVPAPVTALEDLDVLPPAALKSVESCLASFTKEVAPRFDVLLIDCPHHMYGCAWAALLAVDWCLVPIQLDALNLFGIERLRAMVATARVYSDVAVLGYVVNKYKASLKQSADYLNIALNQFGELLFINKLPDAADIARAANAGLPIGAVKPKSKAARDVKAVADEIVLRALGGAARRLEGLEDGQRAA